MKRFALNSMVIAAALGAAAIAVMKTTQRDIVRQEMRERCYGITRAGKNDCGTPSHSCAGQSRKDADPESWVMLPRGLCEKITGGKPAAPGAEHG